MKTFFLTLIMLLSKIGVCQNAATRKPDSISVNSTAKAITIIRGKVYDKGDNAPIPGATVIWEANSKQKIQRKQETNFDGSFIFELPDSLIGKRTKIIFRSIGYSEKQIIVKKAELPIYHLQIFLSVWVRNDDF